MTDNKYNKKNVVRVNQFSLYAPDNITFYYFPICSLGKYCKLWIDVLRWSAWLACITSLLKLTNPP